MREGSNDERLSTEIADGDGGLVVLVDGALGLFVEDTLGEDGGALDGQLRDLELLGVGGHVGGDGLDGTEDVRGELEEAGEGGSEDGQGEDEEGDEEKRFGQSLRAGGEGIDEVHQSLCENWNSDGLVVVLLVSTNGDLTFLERVNKVGVSDYVLWSCGSSLRVVGGGVNRVTQSL